MKVLLYGEFSGVHLALAKGLRRLGCDVDLLSVGDGFKAIDNGRLSKRAGTTREKLWADMVNTLDLIKGCRKEFDVVQFISPRPGLIAPATNAEIFFMSQAIKKSRTSFYYVAGCDSNTYGSFSEKPDYFAKLCAGCQKDRERQDCIWHDNFFSRRTQWLIERVDGIIAATDGGYRKAHESSPKFSGTIKFPVDGKPAWQLNKKGLIKIVHGINRRHTKGSDIIIEALAQADRQGQATYEILHQLPFEEYAQKLRSADIVIDQLFGDGLGMNALHAMAMGSLVLTRFDSNLYPDAPALDVGPTRESLVASIENGLRMLIEDRNGHSDRCSDYVRKNHDVEMIAEEFLAKWSERF